MAYENLKAAIKQAIKQNGNQEITGNLLQSTLLSMADNIHEVVQSTGEAEDKVMSQKATSTELGKKADKTYVDTELGKKVDKTYVDTELGKKVDKTFMNTELDKKIDKASIAQTSGKSENFVMSQKAVSDKLNDLVTSLKAEFSYKGIAQPTTNPGVPDSNVFYIAGEGSYPNFNNQVVEVGQIAVLKWDGSWHKETIEIGAGGGNMILDWTTDVATTRNQVLQKYRKPGTQISYKDPEKGWINEQFIGTDISNLQWANSANWEGIIGAKKYTYLEEKLTELSYKTNLSFTYEEGIGIIGKQGEVLQGFDSFHYKVTPIYYCKKGDIFKYKGNNGDSAIACAFYKDDKFVSYLQKGNQNEFTNIVVGEDVNGVKFTSFNKKEIDVILEVIGERLYSSSEELKDSVDELQKRIDDTNNSIEENTNNIESINSYLNQNSFPIIINIKEGNGFLDVTGNISGIGSRIYYKKTQKIPCKQNDIFLYKGRGADNGVSALYYNDDDIVGSYIVDAREEPVEITIGENINSVVFASFETIDKGEVVLEISSKVIATSIEDIESISKELIAESDKNFNEKLTQLQDKLEKKINTTDGISIIMFGDSITQGTQGGFIDIIRTKTTANIINEGHSGTSWPYLVDLLTGLNIRGQVNRKVDISSTNLISIQLGTNSAPPFGNMSDIPNISIEDIDSYPYEYTNEEGTIKSATLNNENDYYIKLFPNTFIGNMALCIIYILRNNPNCRLFFITIPPSKKMYSQILQANETIRTVANYFSIPIIDAFSNSQLSIHNIAYWSYDGTHFNNNGNNLWGNYLANEFIRRFYSTNIE